jgi:hypothetical protein
MKKVKDTFDKDPNIEKLNISISMIKDVSHIMLYLMKFPKLKELDLSCNRIETLPDNLSYLETLERLDVSNNLFKNIESVLFALNTIPNLKELNITYDPNKLKHTLGFYLPRLMVINGEVLKSGGEPTMKNPIVTIKNGKVDISKVKSSKKLLNHGYLFYEEEFDQIKQFQQNIHKTVQTDIGNPSQQSMEFLNILQKLNQKIRDSYDYNNSVMEKCYDGLYQKNVDTFHVKKEFMQNLCTNYTEFLKERFPRVSDSVNNLFEMLFIFLDNVEKQAKFLDKSIFKKNNTSSSNNFQSLSRRELMEQGPPLNNANNEGVGGFSLGEKTLLKLKLSELESEIKELKRENKHVYSTLVSHSKQDILEFTRKVNAMTINKNKTNLDLTKTNRKEKLLLKGYTLRQMNDLIYDIMQNKKVYDERSSTQKIPSETMENFLFIYFSQKYGLKDLVMVEVTSVIDRIKTFSDQSTEVEVFKKILKNEVDDKFYWFLQNTKDNLKKKLEVYYKINIKKKASLVEINNYVNKKIQSSLTKKEGDYLVNNSYVEKDLKKIKRNFQIYFDQKAKNGENGLELDYYDFLEFLFKYELEKHEKYLKFVSDFFNNKLDLDHNGVITRKQFLSLLEIFMQKNINCNLENILNETDPHNFNAITFSQTVNSLTNYFVDEAKTINLIDCINDI